MFRLKFLIEVPRLEQFMDEAAAVERIAATVSALIMKKYRVDHIPVASVKRELQYILEQFGYWW